MKTISSARLNRCAKDVGIHALVIPKLELVDVEMQILFANFVECAHDPAFHNGPETLDGIGMHCTDDILALGMIDDFMRILSVQLPVPHPLIRNQQADLMRDSLIHKASQGIGFDIGHDPGHHVALALHGSSDDRLPRSSAARAAIAVIPMPVLGFPADECFIHLDIAYQLLKLTTPQRHADFVAHEPRSFVGTESHIAADLKRANALLTGQHQMNDAEPFTERLVGVLEDRPNQDREAIADASRRTLVALPMVVLRMWVDVIIGATRTARTFRPSVLHQIFRASLVVWELALKIANRHLMNLQRVLLFFPHGLVSRDVGASMPC